MSNLLKWAPAVGAFSRIAYYRKVLSEQSTYFDRLRIVNDALGANWVFRLADAVGIENIRASRPSWAAFYVDDCDRLHCPLDPGAPETAVYLGREYADMDMAFYAGMGFDGYRLVLQTPRLVDIDNKTISFDGRYQLRLLDQQRMKLDELYAQRVVPKWYPKRFIILPMGVRSRFSLDRSTKSITETLMMVLLNVQQQDVLSSCVVDTAVVVATLRLKRSFRHKWRV